jgi:hypothetical protein
MKVRPPRKKLSADERRALCQAWKTSSLSQSEFCKQQGVALSSFHQWLSGRRLDSVRQNVKNNADDWAEVAIKNSPAPITEELLLIEMVLPNQIRLKLSIAPSKMNSLIEELSHAATALR